MLTYDPRMGFLLNGQQANLHGRVGRNVLDANTAASGALDASRYDPRYYESYTFNDGDAGERTAYRLRPDMQERVGNRTQLQSHSVGGYGEAIDPSQVDYDEEFGLMTDRRNIKDPATPRDNLMGNLAMAAFAAPIAYGVALNSGLLGAGSMGTVSGLEPITLPALEGAPALASAEGLGAGAGASGFPAGAGIAGPTLETAGMASQSPSFLQQLMAGAQSNPMMAARALLGGANVIDSLRNRGSSTPGLGGDFPAVNVQFNPQGLLANYKPLQVGTVPFMGRSLI